ncbi:MAG TPA: hypothetical protein VD971_07360 [Phycisphaerales bacterium]|nr:hypothetical protein [Phycisphaerales bacterium]
MAQKTFDKLLTGQAHNADGLIALIDESMPQSDRETVIFMVAMIDAALVELIAARLAYDNEGAYQFATRAELTGRASLALYLGIIDKDECGFIEKMADIRNHFAHRVKPTFSDTDAGLPKKLTYLRDRAIKTIKDGIATAIKENPRASAHYQMVQTNILGEYTINEAGYRAAFKTCAAILLGKFQDRLQLVKRIECLPTGPSLQS